jgi:hypothetical protein
LVAIATTAPIGTGLVGALIGMALMRAWKEDPNVVPSDKV